MPKNTLYVTGFSRESKAADLAPDFEKYGELIRLDIPPPRTDDGEKYAFVEYRNPEDCERALELDGKNLPYAMKDGLVVQLARSDPYSMRRGGYRGGRGFRGGYGGYPPPPRGGYGYGGPGAYPPRGGYGYAPRGGYGYGPRGGYGYAPRGGYNGGYNGGYGGGRGHRGGYGGDRSPGSGGNGAGYGGNDREYRSHRGGPMRDQGYDNRGDRSEGDIHDGPINDVHDGGRPMDSGIRDSEGNNHREHERDHEGGNSGPRDSEDKPHREERRYSRSPSRSPRRDRSRSPERY